MNKSITIGISTSSIFDMRAEHEFFLANGADAYATRQRDLEHEIFSPGPAFSFLQKLLGLQKGLFAFVIVSRNSPDSGLRASNSLQSYGLMASGAVFAGGQDPFKYARQFEVDLFLSTNAVDVRSALADNFPAGLISPRGRFNESDGSIRIAFDGDSVLFSDESQRFYELHGLEAFNSREIELARTSMAPGPLKPFLQKLHEVQEASALGTCPIRTALITSRAAPAHARVIKTLREWGVRVDESFFVGGPDKLKFLEAFQADIFFDDNSDIIATARDTVLSVHVPR